MSEENKMEVGPQPLNELMETHDTSNHDLVAAVAPGFITHKQVQKARKGRRLTIHLQEKILEAMNSFSAPKEYEFKDLFNYRGKKSL